MGRGCEPGWGSAGPTRDQPTNPHWFVWGNVRAPKGAVAFTRPGPSSRDLGTLEGR